MLDLRRTLSRGLLALLCCCSLSQAVVVTLPESGENGLSLHLDLGELGVLPVASDDGPRCLLQNDGASFIQDAEGGWLSLTLEVGLPPDASVRWHETERREARRELPPPAAFFGEDGAGMPRADRPRLGLQLLDSGWVRGQRVQRIRVDLALPDEGGQWRLLEELAGELRFVSPKSPSTAAVSAPRRAWVESESFDRLLSRRLLNGETARAWRRDPARNLAPAGALEAAEPWLQGSLVARVMVAQDGLHTVSGAWLEDRGLPIAEIDPARLQLWNEGREVPVHMVDGHDGRFDRDDFFIFAGRHRQGENFPTSFFSPQNPYFITWDGGTGQRLAERVAPPRDGDPVQERFLQETHYESDRTWDVLETVVASPYETDHWFWRLFGAVGGPETHELSIAVPDATEGDSTLTASVRYCIRGISEEGIAADHHLIARLEGHWAGDVVAASQDETVSGWFPLPPGLPRAGDNVFEFLQPLDQGVSSDLLYFNWLDLRYPRRTALEQGRLIVPATALAGGTLRLDGVGAAGLYAVGESGAFYSHETRNPDGSVLFAPRPEDGDLFLASDGNLLLPEDLVIRENARLKGAGNRADMLIVSTADFLPDLQELAAFHGQSMSVKLVDVEAIYNEFSRGRLHTRALHDFLRHTQLSWGTPAPSYVLLVGKASYANRMKLAREPLYRTQVPADWIHTSPNGATSTDEEFCYLVGDTLWTDRERGLFELEDDRFQDIMIGRVPITNRTQLTAYLAKHREYRERQYAGEWMEHQVHVADEGEFDVFEVGNQLIAEYSVPPELTVSQLHVRDSSPYDGGALDFIDLFNEGCSVLNYNGHGAIGVLSSTALFRATDIRFLSNRGKYPIGFAWSCSVADFDNADSSSMAELLVKRDGAGAIAFYGAAAKAYIVYDNPYMVNWFSSQYNDEGYTFGEIVHLTESMMQATSGGRNVTQLYNLLGDPALLPALPRYRLLPDESMLVAGGGETVQVTLATDPPGLSGDLRVTWHARAREPLNFLGRATRTWNLSFSDGQTIDLDLPADDQPRRGLLRFAMNAAGDRAVGALPLFLNSSWAAAGGHEPTRGRVGGGLDFRLETGVVPDSVELRTNYSLAYADNRTWFRNGPMLHQGNGVWTFRIDSLTAPWGGNYANLTREWLLGSPAEDGDFPTNFAARGLVYRFRIFDEEPFVDGNANGRWDPGEAYTDENANGQWDPAGEPFVDLNGDGLWNLDESYTDVNGSGAREGWIDLPGRFVPIDLDEGLVLLDSLLTVVGNADTLAARLRWQVATVQDADAAVRRLEARAAGEEEFATLFADTAAVRSGAQQFDERVVLGPGFWETRFQAGPLFLQGVEVPAVQPGAQNDAFLLLTGGEGSGGNLALPVGGSWSLDLPAGRLQAPLQLRPVAGGDPFALRMQGGQPGLGMARPAAGDSLLAPLRLGLPLDDGRTAGEELDDQALRLRLAHGLTYAFVDGEASAGDRPALARWVSSRGLWVVQPGAVDSLEDGWELRAPLRLHDDPLWPVAVRDEVGPTLELAAAGQWFGDGDLVPREPVFQIHVADADGLDLGEGHGPPRIWLDDVEVETAAIGAGEGDSELILTWSPGLLEAGSQHHLKIEAGDALGNRSLQEADFRVGDRLALDFFANHPNPFTDRTTFAWQLSGQPRSLRFEIYTASGRLIRRLDVLAPRIGYDELVWDGTDRDGRQVANGVYFCRMRVEGDGDVEQVFKLARLQ